MRAHLRYSLIINHDVSGESNRFFKYNNNPCSSWYNDGITLTKVQPKMLQFIAKNQSLHRDVMHLTLPVITEQTFIILMGVVNTMMAGHISKEAAAAIGIVDSLNNIFIAAFSSLAVGGTVVVAHYTGKANPGGAGDTSKQSIYGGLVLASLIAILAGFFRYPLMNLLYQGAEPEVLRLAFTYLEYTLPTYPVIAITTIACGVLRGSGNTKTPAQVVIMMNIVNIIASYIFIFGINFPFVPIHFQGGGVRGAAIGIGIARLLGTIVLIYILVRGSSNLKVEHMFHYKPDWRILISILNIGIPASIESLLFSVGKLITQTFVVPLGTVAIVANNVGNSLHGLMMITGNALTIAATALVGQHMGKKDFEGATRSLGYMNTLAVCFLLTINLIAIPLFPFLAGLYTPSHEITRLTVVLMTVTSFMVPMWPFAFVLPAGLKGAGDVRYTLIVSTLSMWIFRISLGYLMCITLRWGVLGVWIGMYSDWLLRGIAFWIRFKNKKWLKHEVIKSTQSVEV